MGLEAPQPARLTRRDQMQKPSLWHPERLWLLPAQRVSGSLALRGCSFRAWGLRGHNQKQITIQDIIRKHPSQLPKHRPAYPHPLQDQEHSHSPAVSQADHRVWNLESLIIIIITIMSCVTRRRNQMCHDSYGFRLQSAVPGHA